QCFAVRAAEHFDHRRIRVSDPTVLRRAEKSGRNHWRGSIPTAIELSEFRQDRSADFSPLPAVLGAPERGGLKSALLNSMPGLLGPLPARASWREGVANPVSWLRYQDAPTLAATYANDLTGCEFVAITLTLLIH